MTQTLHGLVASGESAAYLALDWLLVPDEHLQNSLGQFFAPGKAAEGGWKRPVLLLEATYEDMGWIRVCPRSTQTDRSGPGLLHNPHAHDPAPPPRDMGSDTPVCQINAKGKVLPTFTAKADLFFQEPKPSCREPDETGLKNQLWNAGMTDEHL